MSSGEIYWQNEMLPQQPNQQTHGDVSRQTLLSTLDTVVDSLIHSRQALRLPPHAHRTSRVQVEIDGHERILDEHIHFTQLPSEAPDDNHFHILRHMRTTKHVTSRSTTTTTRTHHNNDGRKSMAPPQQQQHQQQGQQQLLQPQATNAPNDARNAVRRGSPAPIHKLPQHAVAKKASATAVASRSRSSRSESGIREAVQKAQKAREQLEAQTSQTRQARSREWTRMQKADSRRSTSEQQRLLLTHADQQRLLEMIKTANKDSQPRTSSPAPSRSPYHLQPSVGQFYQNAITPYYQRPAAAAGATSTVPPALVPSLSGGPSRFERGPHADECRAKQIPVQPDPSCFCGGPNRPSPGADMPNWETEKGRAKARDARVPRQYDRHGAVTAWNRYYERPRPGGYARDGGGAMAAVQLPPQQPPVNPSDNLFYGAVEVEANVAIAVKNLLKARTCMRNVHFAVGSLFPASATYTDDIGKMQQQLKAFNTQFRYLNTKVNEKLSAGPRQAAARAAGGPPSAFEKPPNQMHNRQPSCEYNN